MDNTNKQTIRIGKFNIVDIIAVVLIAIVALFVVWKVVIEGNHDSDRDVTMVYTVLAENVSKDLYENTKAHLPSTLMASGALLDGEIQSVERGPYYELGPDGVWVEDPEHINLYFKVVNHTKAGDVLLSKVGEQEVRIGRKDYTLKTEYIEFHNTIILDVEWS